MSNYKTTSFASSIRVSNRTRHHESDRLHDITNPTVTAKTPIQWQNTDSLKNAGFESIWLMGKRGRGGGGGGKLHRLKP